MALSNADYHADPAVSASHLHAVAQSPQSYWARYLNPDRPAAEPTAAMQFGSLVHCAVLEPDELLQRYGVAPDRRTKAGKDRAEQMSQQGIQPTSATELATAQCIADAVRSHPVAATLLASGQAEQSFWWDDMPTGLRCKCRPDWYYGTTVVDLKTTTDASPAGFARSVAAYRYHVQAAHYLSGLFGAERFVFIAVEKTYPYAVGVYELDEAAMDEGHKLRNRDMRRIQSCYISTRWPGYTDDGITALSLPRWGYDNGFITPEDF